MEVKNGIQGKVVAITGASSGIGEAIAILLASYGAKVVLGARRKDKLQHLAEKITQSGGTVAFMEMDVKRREDVEQLAALAEQQFGKMDVMINNAGVAQLSRMEDLDIAGWEEMIDINLKGVLYGISAALPIFKNRVLGILSTFFPLPGSKLFH